MPRNTLPTEELGPSSQQGADISIETMSQASSASVTSVTQNSDNRISPTEAQAKGYTIGVITKHSNGNNKSPLVSANRFGPRGNYANVYKKETEVILEERPVAKSSSKTGNMNYQIYPSVNSYKIERTVPPTVNGNYHCVDGNTNSKSNGNGNYLAYNVQNGAIYQGHDDLSGNHNLNYRNISSSGRHARSRTMELDIEYRSQSAEGSRHSGNDLDVQRYGKHVRSRSADPYENLSTKISDKEVKPSQGSKEKSKPTSRLMAMKNKLKQSQRKKDSADKKASKEKGSKSKLKKAQSEKSSSNLSEKDNRIQELLDMQLPHDHDEDPQEQVHDGRNSRHSSIGREEDVFTQNCEVHMNGHQIPRPLHQSMAVTGYSMSHGQIGQSYPPKPPRSHVISRSHDQLPHTQQPIKGILNRSNDEIRYGYSMRRSNTVDEKRFVGNRTGQQNGRRSTRSHTVTLDSRAIPKMHEFSDNSAHALALSGSSKVVTKQSNYSTVTNSGFHGSRGQNIGYHSDSQSDDSSVHSNTNYSDPYIASNEINGNYGYHRQKDGEGNYMEVYSNTKTSQATQGIYQNYADIQGDSGPTVKRGPPHQGGQLEQILEVNENTGSWRRGHNRRGKFFHLKIF